MASEAARAIRGFAFTRWTAHTVVSIIHPQNLASKRVAAAIGMTFSRASRFYDIDVEIFSTTKWPNRALPMLKPDPWPYAEPPTCATFVTTEVFECREPMLVAVGGPRGPTSQHKT